MTGQRIGAVAIAYPRGELPFLGEWLEYHLTLGVSHVFLALHVNEDLVPTNQYLPVKRPYPPMYELDLTEADVLRATFAEIRPFKRHVTTYLLHRRGLQEFLGPVHTQARFYNEVLAQQRTSFDWIAPFDVDEYLVPQPPFESIPAALASYPPDVGAVEMEQVIVTPRWDEERRPRPRPLLVPDLARCSKVVPARHGMKTIARARATTSLHVHTHQLVEGSKVGSDQRILTYHLRGFPAQTEIEWGYRLPIEHQEYDLLDDRPWRLLHDAPRPDVAS